MRRYLLLEVINPHTHYDEALGQMDELADLVKTLGGVVVAREVQHRVKPHPATYMGAGKLEALKLAVGQKRIDTLVLNGRVSSGQKYRIARALWNDKRRIAVWDRVDLILKVFDTHAVSAEAKLQIELARLTHEGPKLYGLGKDLLSRQAGGIGTRGIGETNIEREKRILQDRKALIRRKLKKLTRRKEQVISRRRHIGLGPVALVGYTSAGKTTLFNRLTGKQKKTDLHLFTTLDTVVGKMKYGDQRVPVVVSDTIGFMQDLPPQLVEAFKSTLIESLHAELVLHVVDVADERMSHKIAVVDEILTELGVSVPVWRVYNKVDLLEGFLHEPEIVFGKHEFWVSAKTGRGAGKLKREICSMLKAGRARMQV
jgi:GTPase